MRLDRPCSSSSSAREMRRSTSPSRDVGRQRPVAGGRAVGRAADKVGELRPAQAPARREHRDGFHQIGLARAVCAEEADMTAIQPQLERRVVAESSRSGEARQAYMRASAPPDCRSLSLECSLKPAAASARTARGSPLGVAHQRCGRGGVVEFDARLVRSRSGRRRRAGIWR